MAVVDTFLFPRTIDITRPGAQTGVGFQPAYAADLEANETEVVSGVPCSLQLQREGSKSLAGLPGGATDPIWYAFIPLEAGVASGTIIEKDVVTDVTDARPVRYSVVGPYWDSLGWRLTVVRLEA